MRRMIEPMFIVRDYNKKIRASCANRDSVLKTIVTFSGLFGCRPEDLRVEDCKKAVEMTVKEFYGQKERK